jgi:glycosyltransferase involved in cell wall biosynthesis
MGSEQARGDVIALLDSDDYWHEHKLSKCMPLFEQDGVVAVLHDLHRVDSESGTNYGTVYGSGHASFDATPRDALEHYLSGKSIRAVTSALLLRRKAALKILPFPDGLRSFHDTYYIRHILFYGKICAIHTPLGAYAVHGSNDYGFKPPRELSDTRLVEMIVTGRLMSESFNRRCREFNVAVSPRRERIQRFAIAELLVEQQRRKGLTRALGWLFKNELRVALRERLHLLTHLTLPTRVARFVNNRILVGSASVD